MSSFLRVTVLLCMLLELMAVEPIETNDQIQAHLQDMARLNRGHPPTSYSLIQRLHKVWPAGEALVEEASGEAISMLDKSWPSKTDEAGSSVDEKLTLKNKLTQGTSTSETGKLTDSELKPTSSSKHQANEQGASNDGVELSDIKEKRLNDITKSNEQSERDLRNTNTVNGPNNVVTGSYNVVNGANNVVNGVNNHVDGAGHHIKGANNHISGAYNDVTGTDNVVSGPNHRVNGHYNHVDGAIHNINGANNNVNGAKNVIVGNNNRVDGANNVVHGNNHVVTGANHVIHGNNLVVERHSSSMSNSMSNSNSNLNLNINSHSNSNYNYNSNSNSNVNYNE